MFDRWLVVTDLDGSLLNHHDYDYRPALPLLEKLQQSGIPVIFNTSKTFAEIIDIAQELNNAHPFIVENGSAIFIPEDYFTADFVRQFKPQTRHEQGYYIIMPGERIQLLNDFIHRLNPPAVNFFECSLQQAMDLTGLNKKQAMQAQDRLFSVPLAFDDSAQELEFERQITQAGFSCLRGGRFLHLLGRCNKGDSMLALKVLYESFYRQSFGVIALGDSQNDMAMLEQADIPVVVKSPTSRSLTVAHDSVIHTTLEAPQGWVEGVQAALDSIPLLLKQEGHHGG